jgi:carbon-monoxide dehydrogenase large subunit
MGRAAAVTIKPNTYVGQPLERVEDARLLTGRGCFVADIAPAGLLHAAIVRSPVAHGRIRGIDLRASRWSFPIPLAAASMPWRASSHQS